MTAAKFRLAQAAMAGPKPMLCIEAFREPNGSFGERNRGKRLFNNRAEFRNPVSLKLLHMLLFWTNRIGEGGGLRSVRFGHVYPPYLPFARRTLDTLAARYRQAREKRRVCSEPA